MGARPKTEVLLRPLLEDIRDTASYHRKTPFSSRHSNRTVIVVATFSFIVAATCSLCILVSIGNRVSTNLDPFRDLPSADRPAATALREKGVQFRINMYGDIVDLQISWVPNDSDFEHIYQLSSLRVLTFTDARLSDQDLKNLEQHFGRLEGVRMMRFVNTLVTPQGTIILQKALSDRPEDIVLQLLDSTR
jgi:hypothetical protein